MSDEFTPDEGAADATTQEQDQAAQEFQVAGRTFKSQDDLIRSYEEAQRKISEQGQRLSSVQEEMDSLMEQMQAPQQNQFYQQQPDPMQHPLIAAIATAQESGDYANAALLQAELNRQYMEATAPKTKEPEPDLGPIAALAEMQLKAKYGAEYDEYAPRASEILSMNPYLVPDGSLNGVVSGTETALRLAREEAMNRNQQSLAQQQAEAEAARQRKLAAQTVTGAGGRPQTADEQSDLWAAIKNSDAGTKFRL